MQRAQNNNNHPQSHLSQEPSSIFRTLRAPPPPDFLSSTQVTFSTQVDSSNHKVNNSDAKSGIITLTPSKITQSNPMPNESYGQTVFRLSPPTQPPPPLNVQTHLQERLPPISPTRQHHPNPEAITHHEHPPRQISNGLQSSVFTFPLVSTPGSVTGLGSSSQTSRPVMQHHTSIIHPMNSHRSSQNNNQTQPQTTAEQRELARKVSHSAIERRRRERINDKIIQLKQLIPSCADQDHLHKLNILQNTIEYIEYLQGVVAEIRGCANEDDERKVTKRSKFDRYDIFPPAKRSAGTREDKNDDPDDLSAEYQRKRRRETSVSSASSSTTATTASRRNSELQSSGEMSRRGSSETLRQNSELQPTIEASTPDKVASRQSSPIHEDANALLLLSSTRKNQEAGTDNSTRDMETQTGALDFDHLDLDAPRDERSALNGEKKQEEEEDEDGYSADEDAFPRRMTLQQLLC